MCLGLNMSNTTQPLGMFECDMALPVLWWRCNRNFMYGASKYGVAVAGRLVVVKKNSYHMWKRHNNLNVGPCSYPYEGKQLKYPACVYLTRNATVILFSLWLVILNPSGCVCVCVLSADIHTLFGNAHGMPCALPFKYNNKWYSECTAEGREDHLLWCATSTRYDETERWGFCPVQGRHELTDTSCFNTVMPPCTKPGSSWNGFKLVRV